MSTYYEQNSKILLKAIKDIQAQRAGIGQDFFFHRDLGLFEQLESAVTKNQLRYYQMEALYVLDYIISLPESKKEKKSLYDVINKETKETAPFLGFEMATGSGKTMLMGASIYYLYKKHGINNFLIIAPSSIDIYQKTIRNFTIGSYDSVWNDSVPLSFNLINGDNYQESLFFDETKDINIFIFNIDKFGSNATNTKKKWESSVWKDSNGNTLSVQDFLKDKDLAIITDEAHHAQNTKSKNIISSFVPKIVLEFTATAVEASRSEEKKNQSIIYKYDIRKFLEDGHGKLVRAVGLANNEGKRKGKEGELAESEKLKLVTLLLIHLIKKRAILLDPQCRGLKPISFVKVKNETSFTEKVYKYIREELTEDTDNIEIILEKTKSQDLEITNLIKEMFSVEFKSDIGLLKKELKKVVQTTIFYHGNSEKEIKKKFDNIRKNEVEIVVYMQKLDEGIDLPNIYTMAVINDNISEFKTSVKQIIGRGVRLNKNKREFDDSDAKLLTQAEKLHIICDQGANFEQQILAIQSEFGLSDKYLTYERERKQVVNKAKSNLLEGKYIPHIKADLKAKEGVNLMELINGVDKIVLDYLESNCFAKESEEINRFLKFQPDSFFVEIDVFSDEREFHKQLLNAGGVESDLLIEEKDIKNIYSLVMKNLYCLPETKGTYEAFRSYQKKLNQIGLKFYRIDESDRKLALNLFVSTFSFFYRNYIEKHYYKLHFQPIFADQAWSLKQKFKDEQIFIPSDQVENNILQKVTDALKLKDLIKKGFYFFGYKNGVYDYVKFDSYTEKSLVDFIEDQSYQSYKGLKSFWIRNDRQIYFTYGSHKYYPDFIVLHDNIIFVIEAKGTAFSDTRKNILLKKLDEAPGNEVIKSYRGLIAEEGMIDGLTPEKTWVSFVEEAEASYERLQSKEGIESSVPEEAQFINYVPAYSPSQAINLFINERKKVRKTGWLKVPPAKYPKSVFAVQVKGSALSPQYAPNTWVLFNSEYNYSSLTNSLVLISNPKIDDHYGDGATIRKLLVEKVEGGGLFGSNRVKLAPINQAFQEFVIENVSSEDELNIVGVEYNLSNE